MIAVPRKVLTRYLFRTTVLIFG